MRRRANFYQNVILTDLELAKKMIFGEKTQVNEDGMQSIIVQNGLVFESINTMGSIFDKLPQGFEDG